MDIFELIRTRQSTRSLFDPNRKIPADHLARILAAAEWAPTAHNMQNFELVVVDDTEILETLARIPSEVSPVFLEENYAQLSFSVDELEKKGVGVLASMFPPSWRTPGVKPHVEGHAHSILGEPIKKSAALIVVVFDPRRRAPASEGDVLGMMSLGCVMENMWLAAHALGIGFHIQSAFGGERVEAEVKRALAIPDPLKIGFAVRLGYPLEARDYVRVRRPLSAFTHRNRYARRAGQEG